MQLDIGEQYKRTDLHDAFGGQRQGGISTPKDHAIVMIFSGPAGASYGYEDGWEQDFFFYTGEGQVGDMELIRGNQAILQHEIKGKRLLLFEESKRSHVTYSGELVCVDHQFFESSDRDGNNRRSIRFVLERSQGVSIELNQPAPKKSRQKYRKPNRTERSGLVTSRVGQGYFRQRLLERFSHKCAVSGVTIPDVLVASHIVPWRDATDQERLDPNNGILLSPSYDALFDRHLISFEDNGTLLVSGSVSNSDLSSLGISSDFKLDVSEGMRPYLERHREALR
mgnify:CR=1 FL=1